MDKYTKEFFYGLFLAVVTVCILFPILLISYKEARDGVPPTYKNITHDLSIRTIYDYGERRVYSVHLLFDSFDITRKSSVDTYPHVVFNETGCYITFEKTHSDMINGLYDFPKNQMDYVDNYVKRKIPHNGNIAISMFNECEDFFRHDDFRKTQLIHIQNRLNDIIKDNFKNKRDWFIAVTVFFGITMFVVVFVLIFGILYFC